MDIYMVAIILFSVLGCGISCYHLGHKIGIHDSVTYLIDNGFLPGVESD